MPVEPTPPLVLHLLGPPSVVTPDGPAELPLGKPLAALCYLALEATGVERTDLARILWPGSPDSRARASIRQALWLIRKQTHPDVVVERNGSLALDPALIRTDLDELDRALAADRLDRAMELWQGGPLRGFTIPSAKHWQSWAEQVRSRWETRVGAALERRASTATGEERVLWLRHALSIRPYRVEGWVGLVHTLVDLRQPDDAAAALAQLRKVADEGDAALLAEAEERLQLLRRAAFGDPSEQMVPEFVGRSEEFSRVMDAWRRVHAGRSRVVGIVGPSGIGKSALAAEVVRHAELDDAEVVDVRGLRTEIELEFGVVASMVSKLLRRPGAAGISPGSAQVLRGLVPSEGDAVGPPPQPTTLSDALADLLDAVSHEAPLVVFVDDAQWMDSHSGTVLLRAMRRLETAPVLALWTCRPPPNGASSEAVAALHAAEEVDQAEVVQLRPLSVAEVGELVTLLLTDADPELLSELGRRLHAASKGTPLHLVELLQGMRDRGHLRRDDDGNWSMAPGALEESEHLPLSLVDTLDQRVHDLRADAHRLGAELASATRPLTPRDLQHRSGWAEPRFDEALSTLFARGLVRWTRDDRVALAHDSLAERFESGGTPNPPARSPWPLVAALTAVTAVALWMVRAGSAPVAPPFGGGTLWLESPSQFRALTWAPREGTWVDGPALDLPGDGFVAQGQGPALLRSGEAWDTVMIGYLSTNEDEPPVASLHRNGRAELVFRGLGDAGFASMAPNGRAGVVNAQHPDTSWYRTRPLRVDLGGSRPPRPLVDGPSSYRAADWSDDGRFIAASADAPQDTLLLLDSGGRRLSTLVPAQSSARALQLCASSGVLYAATPPGELTRYSLWHWPTGRITPINLPLAMESAPTCSPDGSAVAYLQSAESGREVVIQPIDGRAPQRIPIDPGAKGVYWMADPVSVPDAVSIHPADDSLPQGNRAILRATVIGTDDDALDRPVEWHTSDPSIASITSSGTVTANRPGAVVIRAVVDGWIEDSVRLHVTPSAEGDRLAFSDAFAELDTLRWWLAGEPVPVVARSDDGQPALSLEGDGRYQDGIITRSQYDLELGGTAEVTVRLDGFPRPDRNRVILCLVESQPGAAPHIWGDWLRSQRACLQWPGLNGVTDMDTTAVSFSVGSRYLGAIPLDTLLRPGEWERFALQLRTDGTVSAVVGDSVIATHPIRLRNHSTVRWRVSVRGAAVDTRLLLRDVTLWREERYGLPGTAGNDLGPGPAPQRF